MLGILTRYELKKMLGGKFFLVVLCLLLLVNVLLNCGIWELYRLMMDVEENPVEGVTAVEGSSFGDYFTRSRQVTNALRERYRRWATVPPEECAAFETAMKEKYGEDVFEFTIATDEMMASPGYFGDESTDLDCIISYSEMKRWNQENQETYESVLRAAKGFGREALEEGDNYGIRRNKNIIRLYSEPRGKVTAPIRGWGDYLFHTPTMLLVFVLIFLACAGSVSGEHDRRTWLLLHTAKNGKGKTLRAKYLAGVIEAAGLTVLFQLVTLLSFCYKIGFLGASQSVSALTELRLCPYPFTVWQYVLLALACQVFAAVVLSILLTTISALSRSSVISYAAGAILLGGCLLLVYIPPKTEWLAGPLALSSPLKYFDSYDTANLFGFPVLWAVVQAVLWCALSGLCVWLAQKVYHRKRRAL